MDNFFYYGIDEDGNLVSSDSSSVLDDSLSSIFPDSASDLQLFFDSVSDNDFFVYPDQDGLLPHDYFPEFPTASDIASELDFISYDQLLDALAAIPGYNVLPSTAAISVFDSVFNGNSHIHYICLGSSDGTVMYYSSKFELSGNTITLKAPVTFINYYNQRVNTVTNYYYTVTVLNSDQTFTPTNQLVYTDLLESYPSLPSDCRGVPGSPIYSNYLPPLAFLIIVFFLIFVIKERKMK